MSRRPGSVRLEHSAVSECSRDGVMHAFRGRLAVLDRRMRRDRLTARRVVSPEAGARGGTSPRRRDRHRSARLRPGRRGRRDRTAARPGAGAALPAGRVRDRHGRDHRPRRQAGPADVAGVACPGVRGGDAAEPRPRGRRRNRGGHCHDVDGARHAAPDLLRDVRDGYRRRRGGVGTRRPDRVRPADPAGAGRPGLLRGAIRPGRRRHGSALHRPRTHPAGAVRGNGSAADRGRHRSGRRLR